MIWLVSVVCYSNMNLLVMGEGLNQKKNLVTYKRFIYFKTGTFGF